MNMGMAYIYAYIYISECTTFTLAYILTTKITHLFSGAEKAARHLEKHMCSGI